MTIDWISSASQKRIPMDRAHPIFYKLGAVAGRKAVVAMSACMATVIACYPSAPALAAQAINLGTVTVTGCGGTLITDSWGNETCVSGFNEGFGVEAAIPVASSTWVAAGAEGQPIRLLRKR